MNVEVARNATDIMQELFGTDIDDDNPPTEEQIERAEEVLEQLRGGGLDAEDAPLLTRLFRGS